MNPDRQLTSNHTLLEVCVSSVHDARVAADAGAGRLELNAALELGGLTPTLGALSAVKDAVRIPVIAMLRPRPGGFCYDADEWSVMVQDAQLLLAHGADGLAFGALTRGLEVDLQRCRQIMTVAGTKSTVFHRAFDVVRDPRLAACQLADAGVTRILTSGQASTALDGAPLIAELQRSLGNRIEILPAAGINAANVGQLLERTQCSQVHGSFRHARNDPAQPAANDAYAATNADEVRATRQAMEGGRGK